LCGAFAARGVSEWLATAITQPTWQNDLSWHRVAHQVVRPAAGRV